LEEAATVLGENDAHGAFGTFALYERGSLHLWQGSDNLADNLLEQALKQANEGSLHAIALRCLGRLVISHCTAGRVAVAEQFLTEGAALLQANPWIPEEFRVAYHLGGAEVALIHGDLDLYSRFLLMVDAALAPRTDPALSLMHAQIQAKGLQNAGRYAEAAAMQADPDGRAGRHDPLQRRFDVSTVSGLLADAGLEVDSVTGLGVITALGRAEGASGTPGRDEMVALEAVLAGDPVLRELATDLHVLARRIPG
jgi:hypothetical protein